MVFISEGMHLRIPVGGLVIGPDGASVRLEVSIDMWPYWADVALDHVVAAQSARRRLLAAVAAADETAKGIALGEECSASMVAISACAFAIDAFYAAVAERAPVQTAVTKTWGITRQARHARIHQTMQRAFRLTNATSKEIRSSLQQIFQLRDQSVHPSAAFSEPLVHPILNVGVDPRFVMYRVENAHKVANVTLELVRHLVQRPRPAQAALGEWCKAIDELFVNSRVDRWLETPGLGLPADSVVVT